MVSPNNVSNNVDCDEPKTASVSTEEEEEEEKYMDNTTTPEDSGTEDLMTQIVSHVMTTTPRARLDVLEEPRRRKLSLEEEDIG